MASSFRVTKFRVWGNRFVSRNGPITTEVLSLFSLKKLPPQPLAAVIGAVGDEGRVGHPPSGVRRILFFIAFIVLLSSIVAVIVLRIDEGVQRNKAEALERGVLALRPGKSGLSELRDLVRVYGRADNYVDRCDESECDVSTGTYSLSFPRKKYISWILQVLGSRPVDYGAIIDLVDGAVRRVEFSFFYRTLNGSWVQASTHLLDQFSEADRCVSPGLLHHPDYAVISGVRRIENKLTDITFLRAGVTPKATAEEYRHAQSINLACIESLRDCSLSD